MKTKIVSLMMITALILGTTIISCKKKEVATTPTLDAKVQQQNTDNNNVKNESDQADQDINNSLGTSSMGGRIAGIASSPLCGVTIDSSQISNKIVIFHFDSTTYCFSPSRLRSGSIKVQLTTGTHWNDAGSILTLTYINFRATYPIANSTNYRSVEFNGTKTLKNINGNDWIGFYFNGVALKYQERALGVQVTFVDNSTTTTATWNSARITQWNYYGATGNPLGVPSIYWAFTSNGDTTVNGYQNTDSWGTNRYGYPFTNYYQSPWLSNTYCGLWSPTSGVLVCNVNSNNYTFTAGVDPQGNTSTSKCAYGFKVSWQGANSTESVVISY
jgi:hypothetical protein